MKCFKSISAICIFAMLYCVASPLLSAQVSKKKIVTWYIYNKDRGFNDLKPYKDIIASISVFGNPPKKFINECHENNIQIYHAVSGTEEIINNTKKIQETVNNYANDCILNGYDGIDLDFENLNINVKHKYSKFLYCCSHKLHSIGKKLSQCVGFNFNIQEGKADIFYNPIVIGKTCDLVRVMCYDMYFAPGIGVKNLLTRNDCQGVGPTSDFYWTKEAMIFWSKYVSKKKLVIGLPAYSNDYVLDKHIVGKQVYSSVPDSVFNKLPDPIWLWREKLNMYIYKDITGRTHLFYASDQKSTKYLLNICNELDINKVGFWHLSSMNDAIWNVVRLWIEQSKK